MRRTPVFVTIAFLAGLGTGFFAHSAGVGRLLRKDPHAADLAAIEVSDSSTPKDSPR
jgi:hypothetical protein